MNDMKRVIEARSDQLNSEDLIGGPRTVTITKVAIKPGTEQPVAISFEGDNGKPYKSCKSMNRLMVHAWGADANNYVGRSLTLFNDPSVKWGGEPVGGIRISHMSHITKPLTVALTVTKGQRKPYTVQPLVVPAQAARKTVADYKAEIDALDLTGLAEWQEQNAAMGESESAAHKAIWQHAFERGKTLASNISDEEAV